MSKFNKDVKLFNIDGIEMLGNFQNGAVIGLDEVGIEYINQEHRIPTITEHYEIEKALKELGFCDHIEKAKHIDSAYVHITDRCNLKCLGCYSYLEERNKKIDFSTEHFKRVFHELKDVGVKKVIISGGEPFLRDDLADICEYAKATCGLESLAIITNGTMPLERYIKVIPFIDELNVSVDGYSEEIRYIRDDGIMPAVLKTISELRDSVPINCIFTLHRQNMNNMDDYNSLAKHYNVKYNYSIFTVDPNDKTFADFLFSEDELVAVAENLKNQTNAVVQDMPINDMSISCRSKCGAGDKLISIGANGNVYPCHMLHKNELVLGNLFENPDKSLSDIVFSDKNPFRHLCVSDIDQCNSCKYKELCGAGCRGRSHIYYDNIFSKDSYCSFIYSYYDDLISDLKEKIGTAAVSC